MIATLEAQMDAQIARNAAVLTANAETLTPLGRAIRDRCIGEMHRRFGKHTLALCENETQEAGWWQEHFRRMWEE